MPHPNERDMPYKIMEKLREVYGRKELSRFEDPVRVLLITIISQNTSDRNSRRAFERLEGRYKSWEELLQAPLEEIAETIKEGGLPRVKAMRIKGVLREIKERRGSLDLSFLKDMGLEEGRRWLITLPGVGEKTASCVLLFSFGKPALPVDTHVARVSKRLGLIPEKTPPAKAHLILERIIPEDMIYEFHLNLIEHGRRVCRAKSPMCDICPLREECEYEKGRDN